VVEWWSGGVVEWWSGGVVEWWSGGVVEFLPRSTISSFFRRPSVRALDLNFETSSLTPSLIAPCER
jgi:hypothetical protein